MKTFIRLTCGTLVVIVITAYFAVLPPQSGVGQVPQPVIKVIQEKTDTASRFDVEKQKTDSIARIYNKLVDVRSKKFNKVLEKQRQIEAENERLRKGEKWVCDTVEVYLSTSAPASDYFTDTIVKVVEVATVNKQSFIKKLFKFRFRWL